MNHRQFEEWLLSEKPLDRADEVILRDHLTSCAGCHELAQSWEQVRVVLRHSSPPEAAAGFTLRWEERLQEDAYRRKSWRGWIVLAAVTVTGLILALRPAAQLLPSLNDAVDWVSEGITGIFAIFSGIQTIFETFLNFFPHTTPVMWLALVNLGAVAIIIIWLVAMKQLAFAKEYQQ